jgi:hypothetical protein
VSWEPLPRAANQDAVSSAPTNGKPGPWPGILGETGKDRQAPYFAGRNAVRAFSKLSTPTTSLVEVAK